MDDVFGGVIVQQPFDTQVLVVIDHNRPPQSGFSGYSGSGGGGGGGSSFSGYSGKSGYSGPSGFSGAPSPGGSGFSGFSGKSGFSGPQGFTGVSGTSGFSGQSGAGLSGFSGYSGAGLSGFSGFSSTAAGASGFSGFSAASPGPSGFSGFSGILGGNSQPYVFSVLTADADPGSGVLRVNSLTWSAATQVFASNSNSRPNNVANWLLALDDFGSGNNRGYLTFYNAADLTNNAVFIIAGAVVSGTGYQKIPVTFVSFSGAPIPFNDGIPIVITFTATGASGFSGYSGGPGPTGTSGFSGAGVSGFSGFSGGAGLSGFSGFSGKSGYSGYSGSGVSGYSGFSGVFGGLVSFAQIDRTTTVVAETSVLTIAADTKIKSVATGTLNTIVFSGGADPSQARELNLDVTGGPYTIAIPVCRRLGSTGSISSLVVQAGYQEFTWEFIGSEYVMSDSVLSPGMAISGYSGYSGGAGATGSAGASGFSGYSGYSAPNLIAFTTQTNTDYTLALADGGTGITMTSGAAHNLTIPLNATVAFPIGTQVVIEQGGAGIVTIVPTGGVTLNGATATSTQFSSVVLIKQGTDTWFCAGTPPGNSGYSGFSGRSGYSAFSGFSGPGGGTSGFSGFSSPGTSGFSGFSGANPGASGFSGFSGKSGYSGYSGSGVSGYSGYSGSGFSGYSGAGLSGFSGFSSKSGFSGYSGFSSVSGFSGFSAAVMSTVNTQTGNYTITAGDSNNVVIHSSASAHTFTIPANSSVASTIGTTLTFINDNTGGTLLIAINTDTLNRGDGTAGTGTRGLAPSSTAVAIKTASTTWWINGKFSS